MKLPGIAQALALIFLTAAPALAEQRYLPPSGGHPPSGYYADSHHDGATLLFLNVLVSVPGYAQATNPMYGHGFGTVSVVAGQTQKVWIGASFQLLRVCNELESKGTVVVTIDGQKPVTLAPGLCTEDYGNTVDMTNHSSSTATILYRTIFEPPPSG